MYAARRRISQARLNNSGCSILPCRISVYYCLGLFMIRTVTTEFKINNYRNKDSLFLFGNHPNNKKLNGSLYPQSFGCSYVPPSIQVKKINRQTAKFGGK